MSPLLIFDFRHDWLNFKAFSAFFTERQTTINLKFYKGIPNLYPILEKIYNTLLTANHTLVTKIILAISGLSVIASPILIGRSHPVDSQQALSLNNGIAASFVLLIKQIKNSFLAMTNKTNFTLILLLTWLLIGIIGLSVYKQHIYDHYFGFLFPTPFLLTGWVVGQIALLSSSRMRGSMSSLKSIGWDLKPNIDSRLHRNDKITNYQLLITFLIISPLISLNLQSSPLKSPPPRTFQHTQEVARTINQASQGQPFNLALIAKQNYDEGYRYFLELWNTPIVKIDPQNAQQTITDQLFVICENQPPYESRDMDCNPISHPKAEIAIFGWAKIDQEWAFPWGTRLYKLSHYAN